MMKIRCLVALVLWMLVGVRGGEDRSNGVYAEEKEGLKPGTEVFRGDFDSADGLKGWQITGPGTVTLIAREGGMAAQVDAPKMPGQKMRIKLPVERIAGLRLAISALIKSEDVKTPEKSFQGIKLMLYTTGPAGPQWQHPSKLWGTFDFKPVAFLASVPKDATEAWLDLGVEATTGRAVFDQIKVMVQAVPRTRPAVRPALSAVNSNRCTEISRLRGVMYGPAGKAEDIETLAKWNVNLIRWQLHWVPGGKHDAWRDGLEAYDKWIDHTLDQMDTLLPLCEKHGIKVLIDLHTPPGGGINIGAWALFEEKKYQDHFIKVWDRISARYKGNKTIWGYDLANEPIEGLTAPGLLGWRELALAVSERIRKVDADHAIIVEPGPGGDWENLPFFPPLPVKGIVYSPHMYKPGQFTHQGVFGKSAPIAYPGEIAGKQWDKAAMRQALSEIRDYQLDYDVPIYIGEFSAIRWAPGESARDYLADCISLFEEFGWDWSYHAFREWSGWSVEYGSDPKDTKPSETQTSREILLRGWFGKNGR